MVLTKGISIVIFTYKGEHLLDKTLHCIAKQKLNVPYVLHVVTNAKTIYNFRK